MKKINRNKQVSRAKKIFFISVFLSILAHVGVAFAITVPPKMLISPKPDPISISMFSLSAPALTKKAEPAKKVKKQPEKPKKLADKAVKKIEKISDKISKKIDKKIKNTEVKKSLAKNNLNSKSTNPNKGKQKTTAYSVIKNPKIKSQIPPVYPRKAVRRGLQGVVIVEAVIDANGLTRNTKVHKSSGFKSLDKAAIKAVEKWQFDLQNQKNISKYSLVRVPVNFVINNS